MNLRLVKILGLAVEEVEERLKWTVEEGNRGCSYYHWWSSSFTDDIRIWVCTISIYLYIVFRWYWYLGMHYICHFLVASMIFFLFFSFILKQRSCNYSLLLGLMSPFTYHCWFHSCVCVCIYPCIVLKK